MGKNIPERSGMCEVFEVKKNRGGGAYKVQEGHFN